MAGEGDGGVGGARKRWALLGETLRRGVAVAGGDDTRSRFASVSRRPSAAGGFRLLPAPALAPCGEKDPLHEWRRYGGLAGGAAVVLRQRRDAAFRLADHALCERERIDNTGLVCLWPAEEVLAHYAGRHAGLFAGKDVLELGAGVGLAGLVVAATSAARSVRLTDGNPAVVELLAENVERNRAACGATRTSAGALYWGRDPPGDFDVVVAADCTFFKDFHRELAATLAASLRPGGVALLFNPQRSGTLDTFVSILRGVAPELAVEVVDDYDARVSARHAELLAASGTDAQGWPAYERDTCYPLLLRVTRPGSAWRSAVPRVLAGAVAAAALAYRWYAVHAEVL